MNGLLWHSSAFLPAVREVVTNITGTSMTDAELVELQEKIDTAWDETHEEVLYEDGYVWPTYYCWKGWSKATVRSACRVLKHRLGDDFAGVFVDIGAGIGLTTAQVLQEFPRAVAIYTNLPSRQVDAAQRVFEIAGVTDRVAVDTTGQARSDGDCVLAFEMLEHVYDPIGFILPYLENAGTFVDGSSFTIRAYGHMPEFAGPTKPKDIRRHLGQALRTRGWYHSSKTDAPKLWNNRPSIWLR